VPLGQWIRLEAACGLDLQSTGSYDLVVTLPDGKPQQLAKLPLEKKGFRAFHYLVITSGAAAPAAFYIDDLELLYER